MFKRIIAVFALCVVLPGITAAAYSTDESGRIEITAVADLSAITQNAADDDGNEYTVVDSSVAARTMSYTLFKPGVDINAIYSGITSDYVSAVKSVGQAYINDDGSYVISLRISGDSGVYTLVANNPYIGREIFEIEHEARFYTEFNDILESGDSDEMQNFLLNNAETIGFDSVGFGFLGEHEKSEVILQVLSSRHVSSNEDLTLTVRSLGICNRVFSYLQSPNDIAMYIDGAVSNCISDFSPKIFAYWQKLDSDAKVKTAAVFLNRELNNASVDDFMLGIIREQTSVLEYIRSFEEFFTDSNEIWGFDRTAVQNYEKCIKDNALRDFKSAIQSAENMESLRTAHKRAVSDNMPENNRGGSSNTSGGNSSPGGRTAGSTVYTAPEPNAEKGTDSNNKTNASFSDMDAYLWAKDSVESLASAGIINGIGNGEYAPARNVTREEFVKMLTLGMKLTGAQADADFSDVPKDSWFYSAIAAAVRAKIVNGSGGRFGTGEYITRQDMAVMLSRALSLSGAVLNKGDVVVYGDSDGISDYAYGAVSDMTRFGILGGTGQNMFSPNKPLSRAEAAVALHRFLTAVNML